MHEGHNQREDEGAHEEEHHPDLLPDALLQLVQVPMYSIQLYCSHRDTIEHRRKIYTEEKSKVVAAVWGTELIQFLAALQI